MPTIDYDPVRRDHIMKKLHQRERIFNSEGKSWDRTAKGKEPVILKCSYHPHIKRLKLQCEYRHLLRRLRQEVGEGLLDGDKLVVAHRVRTNAFIATYTYNFPQDDINCENYLTQDDAIVCENKRDMGMGGRIHRAVCLLDNATFYIEIHISIRLMKNAASSSW